MSDLSVPLPRWHSEDLLPANVEPAVHDWLFDQGSLTRRLTVLADGAFSVEPLLEGWQVLRDDECAALDVPSGSQGWVREVYLHGRGQPWVFARSVAARAPLEASGFDLALLGTRSLGELLFSDSAFRRDVIEVCLYPMPLLPKEVRRALLWGRRSCFRNGALGVLVAEVFLPRLWRAAGVDAV